MAPRFAISGDPTNPGREGDLLVLKVAVARKASKGVNAETYLWEPLLPHVAAATL